MKTPKSSEKGNLQQDFHRIAARRAVADEPELADNQQHVDQEGPCAECDRRIEAQHVVDARNGGCSQRGTQNKDDAGSKEIEPDNEYQVLDNVFFHMKRFRRRKFTKKGVQCIRGRFFRAAGPCCAGLRLCFSATFYTFMTANDNNPNRMKRHILSAGGRAPAAVRNDGLFRSQ